MRHQGLADLGIVRPCRCNDADRLRGNGNGLGTSPRCPHASPKAEILIAQQIVRRRLRNREELESFPDIDEERAGIDWSHHEPQNAGVFRIRPDRVSCRPVVLGPVGELRDDPVLDDPCQFQLVRDVVSLAAGTDVVVHSVHDASEVLSVGSRLINQGFELGEGGVVRRTVVVDRTENGGCQPTSNDRISLRRGGR